jgi:hypothetical protein
MQELVVYQTKEFSHTNWCCNLFSLLHVSLLAIGARTEAPSSGLYFTLGDIVYLPGDTVLITDIGVVAGGDNPGTSLVCRTEHVNTWCCRGTDGGKVGEWFDPNGNLLPRFGTALTADFSRNGYTHQVRLNRRNEAMSPTGAFECRVPRMEDGDLVVASITISAG